VSEKSHHQYYNGKIGLDLTTFFSTIKIQRMKVKPLSVISDRKIGLRTNKM
jgi:hypothetical protein